LQDSNYARFTKEAKALDVKGINFKNTIIVHIFKGSNLVEGSKSCIDLTSCIDFTNRKKGENWIKAKKANRAKLRDELPRAFAESPYKLRSKPKSIVTKSTIKRTKFSDIIVKIAKAMLVAKVELE
jgi:hypothetical protein